MARALLRAVVPAGHPPLYFMQALRPPVQFKVAWQLPVEDDVYRVADGPQGSAGYFFGEEIQLVSDIGQADAPWPADIRDWPTEDELEDYSQAAGYCVQRRQDERTYVD